MWIFTRYGYFESSVPAPQGGAEDVPILIRSPRRSHLRNLQRAFPELAALPLGGNRAAGWVLPVPRASWREVLHRLAAEVDYADFRTAVRESGHCDLAFYEKLAEVARAVGELQGA